MITKKAKETKVKLEKQFVKTFKILLNDNDMDDNTCFEVLLIHFIENEEFLKTVLKYKLLAEARDQSHCVLTNHE